MTAVVSLLFITMIPIDCKITDFSLYLFYLFGNNYNIGELTSATSKESSYASKLRIHVCLPPVHSVIDREEHEKHLLMTLYGNMEYSLMTACTPMIDESQ